MSIRDRLQAKKGEKNNAESRLQPHSEEIDDLRDIYTLMKEISAKMERYIEKRRRDNGINK